MKTYTIYTAKTHLSQLIEQACAGEVVVIAKGKNPVVKLVPVIASSASGSLVQCGARPRSPKLFSNHCQTKN